MTQARVQRAAAMKTTDIPADGARMLPFPAQMRVAQPIDWFGQLRYQLDGIASTVEQPYRMYDAFGEYDEVIDRNAFTDSLARNPDVAFLVNHKGVTMARTRPNSNGQRSLQLRMGETGLETRAFLNPQRQDVQDLVHAINDGDVTEMSFAFRIDEGEWNDDFTQFRIRKVDIDRGDVSAVNYGANPYTSIAARSRELLVDLDRLPLGAAREAMSRLQARLGEPAAPSWTVVPTWTSTNTTNTTFIPAEFTEVRGEPGPELTELAKTGAKFTASGKAWDHVQPNSTEIFVRAAGTDGYLSLGYVTEVEQNDAPHGPVVVRTAPESSSGDGGTVLPPSPLLPPVKNLPESERSDRGRSVRLARLEWQMHGGEWDD